MNDVYNKFLDSFGILILEELWSEKLTKLLCLVPVSQYLAASFLLQINLFNFLPFISLFVCTLDVRTSLLPMREMTEGKSADTPQSSQIVKLKKKVHAFNNNNSIKASTISYFKFFAHSFQFCAQIQFCTRKNKKILIKRKV